MDSQVGIGQRQDIPLEFSSPENSCGRYCLRPIWSCLTAIASIVKQILSSCCSYFADEEEEIGQSPLQNRVTPRTAQPEEQKSPVNRAIPDVYLPNYDPPGTLRDCLNDALARSNVINKTKLTLPQRADLLKKLQVRIQPYLEHLKPLKNFNFNIINFGDKITLQLMSRNSTSQEHFKELEKQALGTADISFFRFKGNDLCNVPIALEDQADLPNYDPPGTLYHSLYIALSATNLTIHNRLTDAQMADLLEKLQVRIQPYLQYLKSLNEFTFSILIDNEDSASLQLISRDPSDQEQFKELARKGLGSTSRYYFQFDELRNIPIRENN